MSEPLVATARITWQLQVTGLQHLIRHYVKLGSVVGSTYNITYRDASEAVWTLGAQRLWEITRQVYYTDVNPPTATLELLSGLNWNPASSVSLVNAGSKSTQTLGSQLSLIFRDTAFKFMRVILLDVGEGYIGHTTDGTGISTQVTNVRGEFVSSVTADSPFNWAVSRGERYLLSGGGACAGGTLGLNNRVRRARGLV